MSPTAKCPIGMFFSVSHASLHGLSSGAFVFGIVSLYSSYVGKSRPVVNIRAFWSFCSYPRVLRKVIWLVILLRLVLLCSIIGRRS